jgi:hypothetical protein
MISVGIKCRVGKTVIFQNNSTFLLVKKPTNCALDGQSTAKIPVPKKSLQVAIPIHSGGDPPSFGASLSF